MKKLTTLFPLTLLFYSSCAFAQQTFTVNTTTDPVVNPDGSIPGGGTSLRSAILQANATGSPGGIVGNSNTINFDQTVFSAPQTITLSNSLPLIFSQITIEGPNEGLILNGQSKYRGFFISGLPASVSDSSHTPQLLKKVSLRNLTLQNMSAQGGGSANGAGGGGGGMGAGGALFINDQANVILTNVNFGSPDGTNGNQAIGGGGTNGDAGGGGGMGGAGGEGGGGGISGLGGAQGGGGIGGAGGGVAGSEGGSGGGGFGGTGIGQILSTQGFAAAGSGFAEGNSQGSGGAQGGGGGGAEDGDAGYNSGNGGDSNNPGAVGGGGGAGGLNADGIFAGIGGLGGGGGGGSKTGFGANGGFGGGGGTTANGGFGGGGGAELGNGGFGGGGGNNGNGGFGGGGGVGGSGGFGGGNEGGGGAAMGGAIFVVSGGSLAIKGNSTMSGSLLKGGSGNGERSSQNGQAFGNGIFLQGNANSTPILTFSPGAGQTQNFSDDIADQSGVGGTGNNAGSWGLTLSEGGTLILSGNNAYTGGTIINSDCTLVGFVSTQNNVTIGSIPPTQNVTDNGNLTFNQSTSTGAPINGTFSGVISGTGSVTIDGSGSVTFTHQNTYTGGTTNNASMTGSTESITGNVVNNGLLNFNQLSVGTYKGIISGPGTVIKSGPDTLSLSGQSTYTGQTSVKKGTLSGEGSIANSDVTVSQGAKLSGNLKMRSLSLAGIISPGNSIGTLTILNNYTATSTSLHEIEICKNGCSDIVKVGGHAQLGGILDLTLFESTRQDIKGKKYTPLTASQGISGTFSHQMSRDRIKYTVQYFSNSVQVLIGQLQDFADASPPNSQSNVARTERYFDTFADNTVGRPDLTYVIHDLDRLMATNNPAVVNNAFNQIQPAQYGELGGISFLHNELVNKTVSTQQQYLRESRWIDTELRHREGVFSNFSPKQLTEFRKLVDDKLLSGFNTFEQVSKNQVGPRANFLALGGETKAMRPGNQRIRVGKSSLWVQSYGQIEKSKSNHGNPSIRSQTGGLSIGGDHEVLCNTYLGILGGFSTTPFHWGQDRGYGKMKSYYGGLYGTWLSQSGLYADGQIIAGGDQFHSKRNIKFPGINRVAKQGHKAGQFSANAEVGYAWMLQPFTLQPFLDGTYMFAKEKGFREKGAQSLNFRIKSKTSQFLRGEVGAQVYRTYVLCDALVRPAFQLSYVHKHPISGTHVKGGIIGEPQSLTLLGDSKVRNQVAPGVGVTVQFTKGLYIIANVSAQLGSGQNLGDALVRVGYDF